MSGVDVWCAFRKSALVASAALVSAAVVVAQESGPTVFAQPTAGGFVPSNVIPHAPLTGPLGEAVVTEQPSSPMTRNRYETGPVTQNVSHPTPQLQVLEPEVVQPTPRIDAEHVKHSISMPVAAVQPVAAPPVVVDPTAPWWDAEVALQSRGSSQAVPVTLDALLFSALRNSAQIRVFSDLPLIRETAITEADAAFDWTGFIDTRWDDINEPVGSTLTTGGPPRFEDQQFSYAMGARRRNTLGGQLEVSQRVGWQQNNSVFFVPNDQGTSRLTVSYTQPLMRGRGRAYNTSLTVLAQIDTRIARDEFSRQLQSHLLEVTRAYWSLYLERAALLQKRRLLAGAEGILGDLERRQELDTVASQVVRARAAVETRRAEILRAEMAVKNAESRIRSLTNDPAWGVSDDIELVPSFMPLRHYIPADMQEAMHTAMQSRPEINQAIKQVKAACVRMNMAKNEILPVLNLVLESYVAGLNGNSQVGGAFSDQFSEGEPSYSVGLQYEYPIWNRAARARMQRRRLEVRQLQNQFQTTTETLRLEVAVAVRELETSFREMEAKQRAMEASAAQVNYISERWRALGGEDRSAALMLDDLLTAQTQLADAEFGLLNAMLTYNLAQMNYRKAVGTLLEEEAVTTGRNCNCNLPGQSLGKGPTTICPECQTNGMETVAPPMNETTQQVPLSNGGGPFAKPVFANPGPAIQDGPYPTRSVMTHAVEKNSPAQFSQPPIQ